MHLLVAAIQMSTHNIYFYKENQKIKQQYKNIAYASLDKSFPDLLLSVNLVWMDIYFITSFPSNFQKT